MRSSLRTLVGRSGVEQLENRCGQDLSVRPEQLGPEDWIQLSGKAKVSF
jgi:capsular polysaccharide biosynthesis protein